MTYPLPELNNNARRALLINEARRWVGVQEVGGNNRGQLVELFLRSVGLPHGYSWCMAFVQWCLTDVEKSEIALTGKSASLNCPRSAGCMDVWNRTNSAYKGQEPQIGAIAIYQHGKTQDGHTGIVVKVDGKNVTTIEGNTGSKAATREGDGVFEKLNTATAGTDLHLVGYVYPWGKA